MWLRWLLACCLVLFIPVSPAAAALPGGDVEHSDLDALIERGVLRVVVPGTVYGEPTLPRQGSPVSQQRELVEAFAAALGLRTELVPVFRLSEMFTLLETGRADLVAANLTITEARKARVDFSLPIDHVHETVLVRAGDEDIQEIEDLQGRGVMVGPDTAFWETLSGLREHYPDIHLLPALEHHDDETILDLLAGGVVDATVRDSNVADMYLAYRYDLRAAFPLGERRPIAWAVRQGTPELLDALNRFLVREQLTRPRGARYFGDLPELRERRVLRILLPNSAASYFLWRGELVGFEFELAKRFADAHQMRLQVVVPPNPGLALEWLVEGRADIAGGFLEVPARDPLPDLHHTRAFHYAQPFLVSRADAGSLEGWEDLAGGSLAANPESILWEELVALEETNGLQLVAIPDYAGVENLLDRLVAGEFDYAVIEDHLLGIELARRDDVLRQFEVGSPVAHTWAVRATDQALLDALNGFFARKYRGTVYNILHRRYFQDERKIRRRHEDWSDGGTRLSPYDDLVRRYAEPMGFDWRLIVAQMYHESRFDPNAKSNMGAKGLMQITPLAAEQVGVTNLANPADNIRAGVLYLDWVYRRFSEDLPVAERVWFALASYNAGLGHVLDARRLATQKGWDPDRWFDNVDRAMLLLSQRKYFSKARHGYVRGSEPVNYLENVSSLFRAYVRLTEERMVSMPGD